MISCDLLLQDCSQVKKKEKNQRIVENSGGGICRGIYIFGGGKSGFLAQCMGRFHQQCIVMNSTIRDVNEEL